MDAERVALWVELECGNRLGVVDYDRMYSAICNAVYEDGLECGGGLESASAGNGECSVGKDELHVEGVSAIIQQALTVIEIECTSGRLANSSQL